MDKLTAIKIKYDDGTYSDEIPISVLSENVEWDSTHTLVDILGNIDVDITGTIQDQITQLFNSKVNATDLSNYVNSTMKTEVASWLNNYISPATGTIAYDASLSIQGAAADAKAAGQIVQISTTKPAKENNRIWVGASEEEYEVPTMDEFNQLNSTLELISDNYKIIDFDVIPNSYPDKSGKFQPYDNWNRTDYVPVSQDVVYVDNPSRQTSDNAMYDANKVYLGTFTIPVGTPAVVPLREGTAYIVISNKPSDFFTKIYEKNFKIYEIEKDISENASKISDIETTLTEWDKAIFADEYPVINFDFKYGYFFDTGFGGLSDNKRVVSTTPIPAGNYNIIVNNSNFYFSIYDYVSDSEGTLHVSLRNRDVNFELIADAYITMQYNPASAISDIETAKSAITIVSTERTDSLNSRISRLEAEESSSQKVVFLGDSIFGLERGDTSIPALVGNYTGATTYNCALGGTEGNTHGDTTWSNFDFTGLSQAIASGDFTNQQAHVSDSGVPSYFASVITELASIDFSTINLICLTYGGNDYWNSHSDVNDFVFAMETNINRILTAYPNLRFLIMNPPYKRFLDSATHEYVDDGDTRQNTFGKTLKDYAESYITINKDIHVPYIDAYNELGINRYNATQWFITNDGSHPSEQGRKETAKLLTRYLSGMLYD